ncbi:MAG: anaerobic ribonucleoside-triphosphate reductase activating protein [Candidatus Caldatribacteriaceae bacterium]
MTFRGWHRVSYIEYPEKISTVLFVAGCNFRCPFCHNPELVTKDPLLPKIEEEEVLDYLAKRRGFLDAVCVTGGEPLLFADELFPFLQRVRELGYLVKVDTNGSHHEAFHQLDTLVDLWGVDFKLPFGRYYLVGGEKEEESVKAVLREALIHPERAEIRTTIYPPFHDLETLLAMSEELLSARLWYWQNFEREKTLFPEAQEVTPYSLSFLSSLKDVVNHRVGKNLVVIRS